MILITLKIYLLIGAAFGIWLILSGEVAKRPPDDRADIPPLSIPELFFVAIILWPLYVWYLIRKK